MFTMRTERRWTDRGQTALEVRICSDATDCVVVGTVERDRFGERWRIRPKTARPVRTTFPAQSDAELALVEHERELWRRKLSVAQRTLAFLERA
jgi:hypothetical protein